MGAGLLLPFSSQAVAQESSVQSLPYTQQIEDQRTAANDDAGRDVYLSSDGIPALSGWSGRFASTPPFNHSDLERPPSGEQRVGIDSHYGNEDNYRFTYYSDLQTTLEHGGLDDKQLVVDTAVINLAQVDNTQGVEKDNADIEHELPLSGVDAGIEEQSGFNYPVSTIDNIDPELGVLRLRPLSSDLSGTPSSAAAIDPELGILRLRYMPQTSEPTVEKREKIVFAQGNLSFFSGDNLLARTEPLSDTTLQSGLTLRAVPRLGSRTFLLGAVEGSILRYANNGEFDYRELDLSLGLYHWLNRRTYVDVGWRNQQFFAEDGGDRFLNDHQLRLSVGRTDQLTSDLKLSSSYYLQASWSDPNERSRLINRFNLGLSHPITTDVDASLFYQLALTDFTQQDRYDSYHQFLAQLQFNLSEETTLTVFGGGRLGDSTNSLIDFDSTLLGISLVMNFALF
ncbi:MAG: hypothetical protein AAGD25_08035 [Cyanobacteria bacterium P01_F01_bin.150]